VVLGFLLLVNLSEINQSGDVFFREKKSYYLKKKRKQRFKVTADHRRLLTYDLRIVLLIDQQYWKEAAAIQCCFY
jgi:hypothetical protein